MKRALLFISSIVLFEAVALFVSNALDLALQDCFESAVPSAGIAAIDAIRADPRAKVAVYSVLLSPAVTVMLGIFLVTRKSLSWSQRYLYVVGTQFAIFAGRIYLVAVAVERHMPW